VYSNSGPGIHIAADVIDSTALGERVAEARSALAAAADIVLAAQRPQLDVEPLVSLATLRAELAELQSHTHYFSTQRLQRAPGLRGRLAYELRRTVRRFTSWYVEPRWMLQQTINSEICALLDSTERTLARLEDDLEELAMWRRRIDHGSRSDVQR
jgi:hypothetical protein